MLSAVCLLSADCFESCRDTNVLQIQMPLPPDIWRWVGTIVQMFGGGLGQLSSKCSSTTATNGQLSSKSSSTTATLLPTFGGHLYSNLGDLAWERPLVANLSNLALEQALVANLGNVAMECSLVANLGNLVQMSHLEAHNAKSAQNKDV